MTEAEVNRQAILGMTADAVSGSNLTQLILARNTIHSALEEAQLTLSNAFIDRNL